MISYVNQQQQEKKLSLDHSAQLILDVFRGQLTNEVVSKMKEQVSCKYDPFVSIARPDGQWPP